jgi:hypothetical protein
MWGSTWGDFDANGYPDVLLNMHVRRPSFYTNAAGEFSKVYQEDLSSYVDRHGCAWGEANGDSRPDMYCAQGANKGTGSGPNQLLVQSARGRLDEQGKRFGVTNALGRGRSTNWLDYDVDGDLDLFVANRFREGYGNVLFRNDRGSFRRVHVGLDRQMEGISSSWSDWDNDGDPDLLVLQYAPHPAFAYENVGGRFVETSLPGISGRPWQSAGWGDFDADGWTDLNLVQEDRLVIMRNDRGRLRQAHGMALTEGRMAAWFDQENDGDLDLFVVQGAPGGGHDIGTSNRPDMVLIRSRQGFQRVNLRSIRGPSEGNGDSVAVTDADMDGRQDLFVTNGYDKWKGGSSLFRNRTSGGGAITLRLRFSRWNPWAYGARVKVVTSKRTLRAELTDGFNFRAQSDVSSMHFGIGRAARASVRVTWPSGSVDCYTVLAGDVEELRPGNGC